MQIMRYIFLNKNNKSQSNIKTNIDNISHSKVIKHLLVCGVVKINNEGELDITFNDWKINKNDNAASHYARDKLPVVRVFGSFIKKNTDKLIEQQFTEMFFKKDVEFQQDGSMDIILMNNRLLKEHKNMLDIEMMYQYNLPENMKDLTK